MSGDAPSGVLSIAVDGGSLPVHVWLPASGRGPGIVLVQEIFGLSAYVRRRAADLARAGYVVHVPDLYWRLHEPPLPEDGARLLEQAMDRMNRLPWDDAVGDTAAALAHLRTSGAVTGPVGLVGFCYGGGVAFAVAAREPVDALVSYYGSALPGLLDLAPSVTAPSLHHLGDADAYLSTEVQATIRAAVARDGVEVHTYAGAGHAFDNPNPMFHDADAAALAWERTTAFLAAHLS